MAGPREILVRALLCGASGIILVHNHPSGRLTPSRQDIKLTGQIEKAAQLLNIPLLDHVILGHRGEFFSFHANGLLAADRDKLGVAAEEKTSICGEIREHYRSEGKGSHKPPAKEGAPGRQGKSCGERQKDR